jgi:hypothetical protein
MKCEEWQTLIEEHVDDALDQKSAGRVTSHIAGCGECQSFYEGLQREQEIYVRYERDVEVTPLLWNSIEARIKQERAARPAGLTSRVREALAGMFSAPRLSPGFAAALVVIAIGITVAVMTYFNSRSNTRDQLAVRNSNNSVDSRGNDKPGAAPQAGTSGPAAAPEIAANAPDASKAAPIVSKPAKNLVAHNAPAVQAKATPAQLVREAEQKYLAAIAMLSRDVNRQRSQLDPTMLAKFDASLAEIDRTIKETRRVVRENPGDPIALQYLLAAYSKKTDVLREMANDSGLN